MDIPGLVEVLENLLIDRTGRETKLECNWCSAGNYVYDHDLDGIIERVHLESMIAHLRTYHPDRLRKLEGLGPSKQEIQTAIESIKKVVS